MKLKESLEMIPTDEMELYSYLSKATEEDILKIRPLISTMYAEGSLIIKQTLMELIGDDEFHEYIDLVKEEIKAPTSMNTSFFLKIAAVLRVCNGLCILLLHFFFQV